MNEQRKKLIACVLIGLFLGAMGGYVAGSLITLNWVAHQVTSFIDVDVEGLGWAIYQYKNNIGECYGNRSN